MQSVLGNTRKADIIFTRKGRISISARVAKILCLSCGDVIDIMHDEREYYLYVKHRAPVVGRHEGKVFRSNKRGHHYIATSVKLSNYILSLCSQIEKVRLCCGTPVSLSYYGPSLPIIVKNIL